MVRRLAPLAALAVALLLPVQAGAAMRYRDPVFTQLTVTKDLRYGAAPGRDGRPLKLKLDLYEPAGDTAMKRPAVIWAHGGGFSTGDKSYDPAKSLAQTFARLGYVTVSVNYRLLAPAEGCGNGRQEPSAECYAAALEGIHDGQAAVRWLRRNAKRYRIDPDRIGIGGESAGAVMAVGAGVLSRQPGRSGNAGFSSAVGAWVSISGGLPNGAFVDENTAPGLLFSGTADRTVPYAWSVQTRDAMRANGVPARLRTLPGAGHVPWAQYRTLFEKASAKFLFRYLDAARAQT